jgi:GrpB-like predicted nucleotidyltransferase (UPF0157 family)
VESEPVVYLIAGAAAAGRSAIAAQLASRFPQAVHRDGASFSSRRLAAEAVDAHFGNGSVVVLEDDVDPAQLGEYRTTIRGRPCHVLVVFQHDAPGPPAVSRVGIWLDTATLTPNEVVDEILARTTATRTPVVIADYDAGWPALFECLAEPVRAAVASLGARVEHVGSTSVPGLAAKPLIDIDVVVPSPADVPEAIERLRALGYVYQGDKGITGREAFLWPAGAPVHHLYVVVEGGDPYTSRIRFRDRLRRDRGMAEEYGALKRRLADEHGADRLGYTDAKTAFITAALQAADPPEGV